MNLFLRRKLSLCLMGALCVVSGWAQFPSSTQLPLVAETDFSVSKSGSPFYSIEDVDGFGNSIIRPTLRVDKIGLLDEVSSTVSKSSFFEKNVYAVTSNPIQVDSFRLLDNGDDEWGIIFSGGKSGFQSGTLLDFVVDGLKPNSSYRVEIEIVNPLSKNYLSTSASTPSPHLNSGYVCQLRYGVNSLSNSSMEKDVSSTMTESGSTSTMVIITPTTENMDVRPIDANGRLDLTLFCDLLSGEAIMIKSIKVYAEPKLEVRASSEEVCVGGENTVLSVKSEPEGASIQWYKDGVKLAGETGREIIHTSGNEPGNTVYYYEMTTLNGDVFRSKEFTVRNVECCVNLVGAYLSRRLVWQEDFGTFTSGSTYWRWDYSEINNPKKVMCTNAKNWSTAYDTTLQSSMRASNHEYSSAPSEEGLYCVAANVTCSYDNGSTGTQWDWEARFGNGKRPDQNGWSFVPDHTYGTDAYGGMLFVNFNGEADDVIYSTVINGLEQTALTAKCFLNTFSDDLSLCDIYLRLTDLETGDVVTSERVSKSATGSTAWNEVSASIDLAGTSLKLEVVSYGGGDNYNMGGNDMVIDDIQLFACAAPTGYLDYEDKNSIISFDGGAMYRIYWSKKSGVHFQYSLDPESTEWNDLFSCTLGELDSMDLTSKVNESVKEQAIEDSVIYLRVVTEDRGDYYEGGVHEYFFNDPSIEYSISNVQVYFVRKTQVPSIIYEESDLEVIATSEEVCVGGENTVLSVKSEPEGASIQWYKDGVKLAGETGREIIHTSGNEPGNTVYYYEMTTLNGDVFRSKEFTVRNVECCVNLVGAYLSRRLVWQEDFGTFTSGSTYWRWDYSEINNPKKVMCTNAKNWSTAYDTTLQSSMRASNHEYSSAPSEEGLYCVAANVTCSYDNGSTGTQWDWEARFGNGKRPDQNGWSFVPDHTYGTDAYGGMLFVNFNGEADDVIYSTVINGLGQTTLTAKCFLNTFSDGKNPCDIYLRLTDLESGEVIKSDRVSKLANGSIEWKEVSASIDMTGPSLKLEVVSSEGGNTYNVKGNDMVIDDIQLWTCAAPAGYLYVSDTTISRVAGDMYKKYWNSKTKEFFQYSSEPESAEWNDLFSSAFGELDSMDLTSKVNASIKEHAIEDSVIYLRFVTTNYYDGDTHEDFSNDPFSAYSISNVVAYSVRGAQEIPVILPKLEIGYYNDTIAIFTRLSEMVGLGENVGILYQYSLSPEDSSSWRSFTLSERLESAGMDAMTELMEKLKEEGQSDSVDVYVRLVAGPVALLSETDEYLPNNPSYVVSNVVRLSLYIAPSEESFVSTEIEPGKFVVTWERFEEASSYVLTIFTDSTMQDTVAIYEFDEQGELIRMNKLRAESESEVMSYTVTNLKTGSYYYTMVAKKGVASVAKNAASFMMPEKVSCESAKSDAWMVYVDESALNVFAPEAGTIKVTDVCGNLVGVFSVEAGATRGIALPAGVYFVRLNAEVKKVLVY